MSESKTLEKRTAGTKGMKRERKETKDASKDVIEQNITNLLKAKRNAGREIKERKIDNRQQRERKRERKNLESRLLQYLRRSTKGFKGFKVQLVHKQHAQNV